MSQDLLYLSIIIIVCFLILLFFLRQWMVKLGKGSSSELLEWLKSTNIRIDSQNKNIVDTLQNSTKSLNERLDNAAKYISAVQKNIGEMSEIGRSMQQFQEFLQSPKLRGNIGEHILSQLLSQMLPKSSFHLQYNFKSGSVVDAAIQTTSGIIPIDSKFPMENFRKLLDCKDESLRRNISKDFARDVKRHIDDIARKYILTDEGTIDYALMYIPSEAIYYEVVNNAELFDYASGCKVLPVSPTTFYAYLKAILMSFEGQKIDKQAKQILQAIKAVQKDYQKVDENIGILSRHINNAYTQMSNVAEGFSQLGRKLTNTSSLEIEKQENVKQLDRH